MAKVTLDNNRTVEVDDAVAAQVEDCIIRLADKAKASEDRADGLQAQFDSSKEELEKARKSASDEAIKEKVSEIASTMDGARKIAGKEFTCDSVDVTEIKKAALSTKKPGFDFSDKSSAYIDAAFDMEMEKEVEDEDEEEKTAQEAKDAQAKLAADLANKTNDGKPVKSARQAYNDRMVNAHKTEDV